jgi:hypothetical protein
VRALRIPETPSGICSQRGFISRAGLALFVSNTVSKGQGWVIILEV